MRHLVVAALLSCCVLQAGSLTIRSVADLPGAPSWKNAPVAWTMEEGRLTITAGPSTDWYISPLDGKSSRSVPILLFRPAENFALGAKLSVEFGTQWDAGMLMVYADDTNWAKFALEMSVYREPTIVTVVTRGVSDDCNSISVSGNSVWLRIAKIGRAFGFYASPDGTEWKMVRAFTLGAKPEIRVGFGAQSPIGRAGRATFSEIRYSPQRIADIFKGE